MKALGRVATACVIAATMAGCYLSDDEGGRTRRQMNEAFEASTGSERGDPGTGCADPTAPGCGAGGSPVVRCGGGYPDCPHGGRCVDDPERGCSTVTDPTCPGVCR